MGESAHMTIKLRHQFDAHGITIQLETPKPGFWDRLRMKSAEGTTFSALPEGEEAVIVALGDLRALEAEKPGAAEFGERVIYLTHDAAAALPTQSAQALGLPPDVHLTLETDVSGILGNPDFRLTYQWSYAGQRQTPRRTGCILETRDGLRRIPRWMKTALDLAEGITQPLDLESQWAALARFRQALNPDEDVPLQPVSTRAGRAMMTSYLAGLQIRLADRFSISPNDALDDFDVLPFSGEKLAQLAVQAGEVSESDGELPTDLLDEFQHKLFTHGAKTAYNLGRNNYLVVDPRAMPVLRELARIARAGLDERRAFIFNPKGFITQAITQVFEENREFSELNDAQQQERVDEAIGAQWVETREFSERVPGSSVYVPEAKSIAGSGTTWLPEIFPEQVRQAVRAMDDTEIARVGEYIADHKSQPEATVEIAGHALPISSGIGELIDGESKRRREIEDEESGSADAPTRRLILDTRSNANELQWQQKIIPRQPCIAASLPTSIKTPLKPHQVDSFHWQIDAWTAGLPGILNADEQGLGKTLQTIAFLNWLQHHMRMPAAQERGPVLIVAPTSLLLNWENEVATHVVAGGFGHIKPLYGGAISTSKRTGAHGVDIDSGLPLLDLAWLEEAISEGRAHRHWLLTTYTTLANYQHSLGRIRFSAVVFDEIQALKNEGTLRFKAGASLNADFRIGLTGTPIENTPIDVWAIMDAIAPGTLGGGETFRKEFIPPTATNMAALYQRLFKPNGTLPSFALRRTKDEVARDLPPKTRKLHPRLMSTTQAGVYDQARARIGTGGAGAALKALQHIRSVSVHPGPDIYDFIDDSARIQSTLIILDGIKAAGERALVFIEHREIQFRFAELVRHRYRLPQVDIINGQTPIKKRAEIVKRFQSHLGRNIGFDLLVLGPKAAGTGLTLTAATHVIHLSRWWNPAVEEQCNDRTHRIGQTHPVTIHVPMAVHERFREHSFDCLLQSLMQRKRQMARQALWPMGDTADDVGQLQSMLQNEPAQPSGELLQAAMVAMFARDMLRIPQREADGSFIVDQ
jgi:hypothetical protein